MRPFIPGNQWSRARRRRCAGALLVDVLVALFVVITMLLSMTSILIASRITAKLSIENNAAYNAARQVIENVRLYEGGPLPTGSYTYTQVLALGTVPQVSNLTNADISMTISRWQDPVTAAYRDPVKQVQVTVTWNTLGSVQTTKSRTLTSLVTPNGLVQ